MTAMAAGSVGRCLEWLERGATAVTVTRRLARHLEEQYARRRRESGAGVWDSPDVLTWDTWLVRVIRAFGGERAPVVLNDTQEQVLWEQVIREDLARSKLDDAALWQHGPAARHARHAHAVFHAWCMQGMSRDAIGDEARAFLRWQGRFEQRCRERGHLDVAAAGTRLCARLDTLRARPTWCPETLVVAGFAVPTPLQDTVFTALAGLGVRMVPMAPPDVGDRAWRCRAKDPEDELHRAASWCRRKLLAGVHADTNAGVPKLGVVISDLEGRRDQVARVFEQVLGGYNPALDPVGTARLFHLSLGAPLARHPVVAAALEWLEWLSGPADFETFSRSLRSPFVKGAAAEWAARGRVDLELRKILSARLTPARLRSALRLSRIRKTMPPVLGSMVHALLAVSTAADKPQSPAAWSVTFSEWLTIAGWPGEHALDSHAHQTLNAWTETLERCASLALLERDGHARQAWLRLMQIASGRVFNPKAVPAPVQLLGVEEAAGLDFDALWVTGMSDEAWPSPLSPLPFLPVAEQRRLGMPEALWEASLTRARDTIARLKASAPEVVFSAPERNADRELHCSPLIGGVAAGEPPDGDAVVRSPATIGAAKPTLEQRSDGKGPALADDGTRARGGAALFKDQAACPFRAFARHRLGSEAMVSARGALTPADHGSMVHEVLEQLWEGWRTRDDLEFAMSEAARLDAHIGDTINAVLARYQQTHPGVMSHAARDLQHKRLLSLVRRVLRFEITRPPFTVVAREQSLEHTFHGVRVRVRADRVDEVAPGKRMVIDYKTGGDAKPHAWFGDHPKEPQLPLYRALLGDRIAGIAFARVRRDETEESYLAGLCDETMAEAVGLGVASNSIVARKQGILTWAGLVARWDEVFERLARSIANGEAAVAPQPGACDQCDQRLLCRIDEREMAQDEDDGEHGGP